MGITLHTAIKIQEIITLYKIKDVVELGSQNIYFDDNPYPPFANKWYFSKGVLQYHCIDLAGDNNAIRWDLSRPIEIPLQFDLVTDIGTGEHVVRLDDMQTVSFHEGHIHSVYPNGEVGFMSIAEGFYNCWKNKHTLCKIGGIIYNENPETKSWPKHGYTYIDRKFYVDLCRKAGYEILDLERHAAMHNTVDGWNIICTMEKKSDKFPTFEEFSELTTYDK